jgi:hypothetical protein
LEQISLRENKFIRTELRLKDLGKRKLLNNFSKTLGEMGKLLESGGMDYDYFENKGHLENNKQEYYHLTDNIQLMSDSKLKASEYQTLLFLRMTVGGLNDMKLLSQTYNYRFDVNIPLEFAKNLDLEKIVNYAKSNNFEYAFLIEIYYHALMMLLKPEQTRHLDKVRELFTLHFDKFTMSEKRSMLHWIANYCLLNVDHDETKFRRIIFELNEFRLKEGLAFYPENQLPKAIYFQILNSALALNESEWAENFIKNYTSMLKPDIRDSMRYLAYAFLYFVRKDYRKVLNNLNKVEFNDVMDKFFVRTLTARSYYELNEMESLLHYIDASRHFLVSNPSVSEMNRNYIQNFFNYLKKIIYIKENKSPEAIFKLSKEIEKNNDAWYKSWLLKKLSELESK